MALGSAHEILNIALTTSPPNAINAKYAHIELWTASALNAPLLVFPAMGSYCSFAYSALACFRIGMSESASFHRLKKS